MAILNVCNLKAGYKKHNVVKDVSFSISEGEVYGLAGLNGAGKTTLIKAILNLRERQAGEVHLNPEDVSFLPEKFEPPWFLTGFEFLKFSNKIYGKNLTHQDAVDAAKRVSLAAESLDENVRTYSKGMRQKLGLLAAIISECPLLILDEPMSGLDPKARHEVKQIILEEKAKGRAIFMSSHVLADIAQLCDRVGVFHAGHFVFEGTPEELLKNKSQPADTSHEEAFLRLVS